MAFLANLCILFCVLKLQLVSWLSGYAYVEVVYTVQMDINSARVHNFVLARCEHNGKY